MTLRSLLVGALLFLSVRYCEAATLFAKPGGSGNCSSWTTACALSAAIAAANVGDDMFVQAGTYGPISLKNGVRIIGGFAGTETQASQSNPVANVTIIDGANTQRAVESRDNGTSTVLRGFVIRNGRADDMEEGGGGLLMVNSSAMVVQCVFEHNTAAWWGGAAAIRGTGAPQFINCEFRGNGQKEIGGQLITPMAGGAVFADSGASVFTNALFHGNKAREGGAVAIMTAQPVFNNCTLASNEATIGSGGGIHDQDGAAKLHNTILWSNSAARLGPQIHNADGSATFASHCDIQGGWTGSGNINSYPLFIAPGSGNYKIPIGSPCKDVGSNALLPVDLGDVDLDGNSVEVLPKDLGLATRKIQGTVDMGAHEAPFDAGAQ